MPAVRSFAEKESTLEVIETPVEDIPIMGAKYRCSAISFTSSQRHFVMNPQPIDEFIRFFHESGVLALSFKMVEHRSTYARKRMVK